MRNPNCGGLTSLVIDDLEGFTEIERRRVVLTLMSSQAEVNIEIQCPVCKKILNSGMIEKCS